MLIVLLLALAACQDSESAATAVPDSAADGAVVGEEPVADESAAEDEGDEAAEADEEAAVDEPAAEDEGEEAAETDEEAAVDEPVVEVRFGAKTCRSLTLIAAACVPGPTRCVPCHSNRSL